MREAEYGFANAALVVLSSKFFTGMLVQAEVQIKQSTLKAN
jgi:hypothetical protein